MELKDYLTVFIATAALITSVSTVLLNLRLENDRRVIDRRKRFSEAIVGLSAVRKDFETHKMVLGADYFLDKNVGIRTQIADARSFHISTAQELSSQDRSIGSGFEHLVLASNLIDRGRIGDARQHYRISVSRSKDPFSHAEALRVYGRSIIQGGEVSQGVSVMLEAAREFEKLSNSSDYEFDRMLSETLDTLRRIAHALNAAKRGGQARVIVRTMMKIKSRLKFSYNAVTEEAASKTLYDWERKLAQDDAERLAVAAKPEGDWSA